MQAQDTSVFSKVMGKVSAEFLARLFSKQGLYQAFLGLIKSKPGVELIYDQRKNTWYVGGSWDAICLIRQQMIVLMDCVFTFHDIQSTGFEQQQQQQNRFVGSVDGGLPLLQSDVQEGGAVIVDGVQEADLFQFVGPAGVQLPFMQLGPGSLDCNQMQQQQQQFPHLFEVNIQPQQPLLFQGFQAISRADKGTGTVDLASSVAQVSTEIPPQMEDSNSSLIEKLDGVEATRSFDFPESCSFSAGDLSADEEDQGNITAPSDVETNQTMSSAILDLSRKVDAVSVNETLAGIPNEESMNSDRNPQLDPSFSSSAGIINRPQSASRTQTPGEKPPKATHDKRKNPGEKSSSSSSSATHNTCTICSKTFLNKSNMVRHARSIHKVTDLEQSLAAAPSSSSSSLSAANPREPSLNQGRQVGGRYGRGQIKDSIENRSCKFCLKVFSTRSNLYKHSRRCRQAHDCSLCGDRFESHDLLCHHVYVAHALFLCRMCDRTVDSEESYADHVNFCHPSYSLDDVALPSTPGDGGTEMGAGGNPDGARGRNESRNQPFIRSGSCMGAVGAGADGSKQPIRCHRPNPCLKCGKVFSTFSNLLKHIRVIHENARFPCNLCKRVFACKDGLKHHMDKIHNKVTYKCDVCSLEFENQLRLAKHLTLIHDKRSAMYNFQCELCGKTFLYKTNLKRHKKLEHEGLRYSCQRCMTSFRSKNQLNEHHRIVHLGLLLKCDACDKQFHTWTTLRDHERAAHGKHAPIVCVVCGKKFTRYPGLSYHLRKHHKRKYNVAGEVSANHVLEDRKLIRKMRKQSTKQSSEVSEGGQVVTPELPCVEANPSLAPTLPSLGSLTSFGMTPQTQPSSLSAGEPRMDSSLPLCDGFSLFTGSSSGSSTYVPSFYDQQFLLGDPTSVQKGYKAEGSDAPRGTFPLPTFVAAFEPNSRDEEAFPGQGFSSPVLYGDVQETTILCLGDAVNFYDNLTLTPDGQQQQQLPGVSFSADEFVTYDQQQF